MSKYDDDMLKQLAAEADELEEAQRAEFIKAHGPGTPDEFFYGVHGSHGSPSVR